MWDRWAPPLRPPIEVRECIARAFRAHAERTPGRARHALVLGVTPEFVALPWPAHTLVTALDHNIHVIDRLWPGRARADSTAVCGDWLRMPFSERAFDYVAGDGSLNNLGFPGEYAVILAALRRVVADGGVIAIRCFIRKAADSLPEIATDLEAGRIASFHILKWRIAMALQQDVRNGVLLSDIWDAWRSLALDPEDLERRFGWKRETIETIEPYRGAAARYTFPALSEVEALSAEFFVTSAVLTPRYDFGEYCPILILTPR